MACLVWRMRAEQELKPSPREIEDLKAALEEIEQRLARRTAELEAAQKELEDFSYSVSHDLRAPLRAVNGFARIALEEYGPQLPEEGRRYLERVRNAGEKMGELIESLVAFSRFGRQSLKCESVDSLKVVQSALEEIQNTQKIAPIEFRIGKLPECKADPHLLRQIWMNLLANAIKFSSPRSPAIIEIGCIRENAENIYFVRDNGVGFDMKYSNKLFGVFQRLHRVDEFPGAGIGLAIAQRLVHRHGGRIWAQGQVDHGATFYFTIEGTEV